MEHGSKEQQDWLIRSAAMRHATELAAACVTANPSLAAEKTPALVESIFATAHRLLGHETIVAAAVEIVAAKAAVPIEQSVTPSTIFCLHCGHGFVSLKRHLRTQHQQDPAAYRAAWGLAGDYPMTAPNYSEKRAQLAVSAGLGQRRRAEAA